ncbi:MAG: DMT family transporter [archaeon]|nr:DMT family transporter [archaeon]
MNSIIGFIFVIIATLLWAISSIGYKYSLGSVGLVGKKDLDQISAIAIRFIVVFIFLLVMSMIFGDLQGLLNLNKENAIKYWSITILCGILTLAGDICYFSALRFIDTSRIYPIINTQILFTFPFAFFIFNEDLPLFLWISSILMIIGVFFIGGTNDLKDIGMREISHKNQKKYYILGIVFAIGTGFFFGTQFLTLAIQIQIHPGIWDSNLTRTLVAAIFLWIYMFIFRKHIPKRKNEIEKKYFKAYILTGFIGILSFAIGDSIYQIGVSLNGAAISIIIASSAPILNQIFAIIFLKEKFRPKFLIGVIFIILGNILVIL